MSETKTHSKIAITLPRYLTFTRLNWFRLVLYFCLAQLVYQNDNADSTTPQTSSISLEKAITLYEAGQTDFARTAFSLILSEKPKEPLALYYLGRLESNREAAKQYYLQVLLHEPEHSLADDALLEVSRIHFEFERYDEAVHACNRLLKAFPDSDLMDECRFLLGHALLAGRRPLLSRMVFKQLLLSEHEPMLVRSAHLAIADSYRDQGDFIEAARRYLKFEVKFSGTDGLQVVLWRAAQCLVEAGREFEAGYVYQRLINRYPDTPEAIRAGAERPLPE